MSHTEFSNLEIALQGVWYVLDFTGNHIRTTWQTHESLSRVIATCYMVVLW